MTTNEEEEGSKRTKPKERPKHGEEDLLRRHLLFIALG